MLNAMVVYESLNGNAQKVAEEIAGALAALPITKGQVRLVPIEELTPDQVADTDLLILGAPNRRNRISPGVEKFLTSLPACSLHGIAVATFDTRFQPPAWLSGTVASKMARLLRRLGARQVAPAECFTIDTQNGPLSPGELERAEVWAASIAQRVYPEG